VALLILLVLLSSINLYKISYNISGACFCQYVYAGENYGSIKNDLKKVVDYLNEHDSKDKVLVSDVYTSVIFPALTPVIPMMSFWLALHQYPEYEEGVFSMNNFYGGLMSDDEATNWLKENHVSYVYVGDQIRQDIKDNELNYSALKEVLRSGNHVLYEVSY
jgi:hypothetical protein